VLQRSNSFRGTSGSGFCGTTSSGDPNGTKPRGLLVLCESTVKRRVFSFAVEKASMSMRDDGLLLEKDMEEEEIDTDLLDELDDNDGDTDDDTSEIDKEDDEEGDDEDSE